MQNEVFKKLYIFLDSFNFRCLSLITVQSELAGTWGVPASLVFEVTTA